MRRGYEIIHCWFIHLIFLKLFSLTLSNYRSSDIFRNLYELLYEDIVIFYTKYWAKLFVQYLIFSTERYRYFHLRFSFFCQQLIYIIIFLSTISETKISDIHFLKLLTLWLLLDRTLKKYFFWLLKYFFSLEHGGRHDEPGDGAHPRHEEGGGSAWRGAPGGRISGICGNNKDDRIQVTIKTTKV